MLVGQTVNSGALSDNSSNMSDADPDLCGNTMG